MCSLTTYFTLRSSGPAVQTSRSQPNPAVASEPLSLGRRRGEEGAGGRGFESSSSEVRAMWRGAVVCAVLCVLLPYTDSAVSNKHNLSFLSVLARLGLPHSSQDSPVLSFADRRSVVDEDIVVLKCIHNLTFYVV